MTLTPPIQAPPVPTASVPTSSAPAPDDRRIQPSDVRRRLDRLAAAGFHGIVHIHFDDRGIGMVREEHTAKTRGELGTLLPAPQGAAPAPPPDAVPPTAAPPPAVGIPAGSP